MYTFYSPKLVVQTRIIYENKEKRKTSHCRYPTWQWDCISHRLHGWMARALDMRLKRTRVQVPVLRFRATTLGKLFTHACLCQHNLVPVKERWCPAAGKVTVGLADAPTSRWATSSSLSLFICVATNNNNNNVATSVPENVCDNSET